MFRSNTNHAPIYSPTFAQLREYLGKGRDATDRPYGNNTRLQTRTVRPMLASGAHGAPVEAIVVKLHATDVVTFLPDGRRIVNYGGWDSTVTRDRVQHAIGGNLKRAYPKDYSHARVIIAGAPAAPSRYRPRLTQREVPAPWKMTHPGDYPTWSADGCLAGTVETFEASADVHVYNGEDIRASDWIISRSRVTSWQANPGARVRRASVYTLEYVQGRPDWSEDVKGGARSNVQGGKLQCPHCAAHDVARAEYVTTYQRWRDYCANVREHGTWQGWRDAATAEYRAIRAAQSDYDAWIDAWTVELDGATLQEDGYACPRAVKGRRIREARETRERARMARERAREYARLKRARVIARELDYHYGRVDAWTRETVVGALDGRDIPAGISGVDILDAWRHLRLPLTAREAWSPRVREARRNGDDWKLARHAARERARVARLYSALEDWTPDVFRDACERIGLDASRYMLAWKRVNDGMVSNHGTTYHVGERIEPDRFSPSPSCGHGLHVAPDAEALERWKDWGPHILAVAVPADPRECVDVYGTARKLKVSHLYPLAVV